MKEVGVGKSDFAKRDQQQKSSFHCQVLRQHQPLISPIRVLITIPHLSLIVSQLSRRPSPRSASGQRIRVSDATGREKFAAFRVRLSPATPASCIQSLPADPLSSLSSDPAHGKVRPCRLLCQPSLPHPHRPLLSHRCRRTWPNADRAHGTGIQCGYVLIQSEVVK